MPPYAFFTALSDLQVINPPVLATEKQGHGAQQVILAPKTAVSRLEKAL